MNLQNDNYYITNYSLNQIIQDISMDMDVKDLIDTVGQNYDNQNLNFLLNVFDLKHLNAAAKVLNALSSRDFTGLMKSDKKVNNKMAFDSQKPRYHQNHSCSFLNRSYLNFEIPVEIEGIPEENIKNEKIQQFKDFCQANSELARTNEARFLLKLEAQFFLKHPPKKVSFDNSGIQNFYINKTIDELHSHIKSIFENASELMQKYPNFKYMRYISAKNFFEAEKNQGQYPEELIQWLTIGKYNFLSALKTYIFKKQGHESICFDKDFLEIYGFLPCSACCSEKK